MLAGLLWIDRVFVAEQLISTPGSETMHQERVSLTMRQKRQNLSLLL